MSRIMIVDDYEEIRSVISTTLERAGHEVLEAGSGQDCLSLLNRGEIPDLILLDVMMPELDGWEVARRIRNSSKYGNVLICMLTAKNSTMDALMSLESAHANWHLNKPISKKKLLETVEWLLTTAKET